MRTNLGTDETASEIRVLMLKLRSGLRFPQREWGIRLRVSMKTISRWECGDRKPNRDQLKVAVPVMLGLGADPTLLRRLATLSGLEPSDLGVPSAATATTPTAAPAPALASSAASSDPTWVSSTDARTRMDLALLGTAEELDMSPRGLRRGVRAILEAADGLGYSVSELRAILG